MNVAELLLRVKGDSKGGEQAMSRIGNAGKVAGRVAAAGLLVVAAGGFKAAQAASDLNEEVSKSKVIFGAQSKAIEQFAAGAATSLGQSKKAALEAASTFGQIGQKAGLSGTATAEFAKKFTSLASDLASFNNTSPEEATLAIGAAMRGESEPIRRFGVLLDDATLRARALKLGLIDNVKSALTPQQKALAASQEILAQTSKAQGDFARTSNGAANKTRIQAAKAANLSAQLGQGLLPAYTALLTVGTKILSFMARNEGLTKAVIVAAAALAVVIVSASGALKAYTLATGIYNAVVTLQAANAKRAAAGQVALNIAMLANPVLLIVAGIVLLIAGLVLAYKKSDKFRAIVNGAFTAVVNAGKVAYEWVKKNWPLLLAILTGPFGLAVLAIVKNWKKIKDGATAVKTFVAAQINAIPGRIAAGAGKIKDALLAPFNALYKLVLKIIKKIKEIKPPKDFGPDLSPGFNVPGVPVIRAGLGAAGFGGDTFIINVNGSLYDSNGLAKAVGQAVPRRARRFGFATP